MRGPGEDAKTRLLSDGLDINDVLSFGRGVRSGSAAK